jgi:Alpha amylase, catalytic domain/Secretion system C-terminal sorting domain
MKNLIRYLFSTLLTIVFSSFGFAQLITTDPAFPTSSDLLTITYDATLGTGGLAGYTGDVYAHIGVITDQSSSGSDWKYVKTDWGQNTPETKLTNIGADLYTLEIGPSVQEYFTVPGSEEILQIALVFRSEDSSLEGKGDGGADIYVDLSSENLNVSFVQPGQQSLILEPGEKVAVEVIANFSNNLALYKNDVLIAQTTENTLKDTITAETEGLYWIKAIASNDTGMVADSFYYFIRQNVTIAELPEGIRDGINYIDNSSVILCLLAPGKEFAFVTGGFNNWQVSDDYYMKQTPDGERFWLEINGLNAGQEYIFQYFIDNEIKVADPYTDKTSDPNDKYISAQTYPGLLSYPDGKTTGVASVLQTAQEEFSWEIDDFTPANTNELVIYEMLIRDFTNQHTYQSIADILDYLQKLGINALELMPVNEFEGNSSWGYNPSFYFAPDKYYGPKDQLKILVDECHKRDIAVFIDLVLNHSYDQSPFVQMYFDGSKPAEDNPWYNREHNFTNGDAQWGNDFNHESLYTQNLVDSVNSYWINEYKIDGFRFDFTKGFGNNIKDDSDPWGSNYDADRIRLLKRMADEIWERNPNTVVILEHLAVNEEEKELADYGILMWGNLNGAFADGVMGYNSSGKSDFSWISYQERNWEEPNVVGYMESHDEQRLMYKAESYGNSFAEYDIQDTAIGLERVALAASFFIPVPGPKMIWQFGELGYDYSINYNGRLGEKPIRWDYYQDPERKYLFDVMAELIDLKKKYDVFKTDDFDMAVSGNLKRLRLMHEDMNVCIVGNFDVEEGSFFPGFIHTGWWYDYFWGDSINVTSTTQTMALQAGEYHIYTDVRLEKPQIGTAIEDINASSKTELVQAIYPNPSTNNFNILINKPQNGNAKIQILDLTGKLVDVVFDGSLPKGKSTITYQTGEKLGAGIYLLNILTETSQETKRLMLIN